MLCSLETISEFQKPEVHWSRYPDYKIKEEHGERCSSSQIQKLEPVFKMPALVHEHYS